MRYNLVRIGSLWLTSTGLDSGKPCKTDVKNLPSFVTERTGSIQISADGTPYAQMVDVNQRGLVIEVTTDFMAKSVFDTLVGIFNTAKNDEDSIEIEIQGDTGNFEFDCLPRVPDDIFFGTFSNNIIKGAGFRVITT